MIEAKSMDIPYEEDVRLAITGWSNTKLQLEPPVMERSGDSDDSDEEDDDDGPVIESCGNVVQTHTWHVATIVVDLPAGMLNITLDGEPHLTVRDEAGLGVDGPLAVDPHEGLMLFGAPRRGVGLLGEQDWGAGGHLRSLRLAPVILSEFEIWSQHL